MGIFTTFQAGPGTFWVYRYQESNFDKLFATEKNY